MNRHEIEEIVRMELANARPRVRVVYATEGGRDDAGVYRYVKVPGIGERIYTRGADPDDYRFGVVRDVNFSSDAAFHGFDAQVVATLWS